MKILFNRFIIIIALAISLISCSSGPNADDGVPFFDVEAMRTILIAGTWKVSHFNYDGENQTSNYQGYILNFVENGAIIAGNGNSTAAGSWSVIQNEDYDGRMLINFSTSGFFPSLNGNWLILSYSNNEIKLIANSSNDTGGDVLNFARN